MSDKNRVLDYMRQHKSITPMEALNEFGCYRLGARVWDLRRDGHVIDTELVHDVDRNGEVSRYAKYTLRKDADATTTAL